DNGDSNCRNRQCVDILADGCYYTIKPNCTLWYAPQCNQIFQSKPANPDGNCYFIALLFALNPDLHDQFPRNSNGQAFNLKQKELENNEVIKLRETFTAQVLKDIENKTGVYSFIEDNKK